MRTMKLLSTSLMIATAISFGFTAQAQIASDNASTNNYPGGAWTTGSNGGTGFGPWAIDINQDGTTFWAGAFIGNPTNAGITSFGTEAFGLYANPGTSAASVVASRSFSTALSTGQTFSLQWAANWDTDTLNRKGFRVYSGGGTNGTLLFEASMNGYPGPIEINAGSGFVDTGIDYGTGPMTWKISLIDATTIKVSSTARDGSAAVVFSTNITVAAAPDAFSIFAGAMKRTEAADDARQPYFNNFQITESPALSFTDGVANPSALGDIAFTLTRGTNVGDSITLSSDNTNAVTVPESATFAAGETTVTFTGTVVSLVSGSATITATDGTASDSFVVNIPTPALSISGPSGVILGTTNTYTVTRTGFATNSIDLSSTEAGVLSVPASVEITEGNSVTFEAVAEAVGAAGLTASDTIATSSVYNVTVVALPPTPTNIYDDATFYPLGWSNGSNGGNGFTSWFLSSDNGGVFIGAATNQAPNHSALDTNNVSFGLYASNFSEASRGLVTPLGVGDVFSFSLGMLWDDGNRGFDLFAGDGPAVFNLNISTNGYAWTGGGSAPATPWQDAESNAVREAGLVLDATITATASGFDYYISSAQDTNLVISGSIDSAAVSGFKFYVNSTPGGGGNDFFFNKLSVIPSTNGFLSLSGPTNVLDVATPVYTLTRNSAALVSDVVYLSSSSEAAATVPATVTFGEGQLSVSFRLDTLAAGATTLTATNESASASALDVTVEAGPDGIYDQASYYYGQWQDGDNNGKGFGAWGVNVTNGTAGYAGAFIGNPADAGITGMDASSFGFYANPVGSGANAEVTRALTTALEEGQVLSFQWGLNYDSGDAGSNRGFSLYNGTTELININMAGTPELRINGDLMFTIYGVNAMTINIKHDSPGTLRVYATGRDGIETYDQQFAVGAAPDNFKFYFNASTAGNEHQMYVNNLSITNAGTGGPDLPVNPEVAGLTITGGQASVTIDTVDGLYYYLVYPTVPLADVTVDPVNVAQWGIAASLIPASGGSQTLTDSNPSASNRVYGVLIRTEAFPE